MAWLTSLQITLILIAIATYIMYIKWVRSKYPPGPWPLPIIGNLHQLSQKPYNEMTKMAKTYGPVFTVWMGWNPAVVVSDLHHIKEALIEKGVDFAGRSMDTAGFRLLFHGNQDLSSRSYDEKVRTLRKLALSIMKSTATGAFSIQKVIEDEMHHLVQMLKDTDGKLVDPSPLMYVPVSNTIMRTVLNVRFENRDCSECLKWTEGIADFMAATEEAMLISLAPVLAWVIPTMKHKIQKLIQPLDNFVDKYVSQHEETYKEGLIRDVADAVIQYQRRQGHETPICQKITRMNLRETLKDLLVGGIQITSSLVQWALLVLLHRNDIQDKIHVELDQYLEKRKEDWFKNQVGQRQDKDHYLPLLDFTLSDRPNLPYLNAFIHETMRLWPIAPLALPHRTMVDTSIGNHSILKGTTVIFNIDGCHKDNAVWEKPLDFIPERFLNIDGQFDYSKGKQLMLFGAGARNCVGENLAKMETFICLANVLHTFELCCLSVKELPVLNDGHFRLELSPYPFKMMFKLR